MTKSAFARREGVTPQAVGQACKAGRIVLEPDGTIDPVRNARWRESRMTDVVDEPVESMAEAKRRKLEADADLAELKRDELAANLLPAEVVRRTVFGVFAVVRARLEAVPSRCGATLAASLGVDAHAVAIALEDDVRAVLEELSDEIRDLDLTPGADDDDD